jgi:hypothetical protein
MASPSSQPNLLQAMLTASRQAKSEEMIVPSEVDRKIEAAKQEWHAQARAEMKMIMSQAQMYVFYSRFARLALTSHLSSEHNYIVSQKDSQIAALAAMNTALSTDLQKANVMIQNADSQWMEGMKKDGEIIKLRGQTRELEEKVATGKEELREKSWEMKHAQRTAEENFKAIISEREHRHEQGIWLAEENCRLEKERNILRDELEKRDRAENRRIIKERANLRASPKNPRRFSHASPIIAEAPQTPAPRPKQTNARTQTNVRSGAGTIIRSRKSESPERKVKNTNSPKAIAKEDRRYKLAVDGVKGKEGAMVFKTLAVTSAIGLVGWAKERGYF